MELNEWLKHRTFHHSQFKNIQQIIALKKARGLTISLCFPTLNEEKTIGKEIKIIKKALMDKHPLLDEIAIVDSGSTDRTREVARELGADVYLANEVLPETGTYQGKGENLWKSLYVLKGDIIVWIDSDIRNIHPKFVYGLIGPLLVNPDIEYVKGFYKRPIRYGFRLFSGGGRVTELLVRPFLNLIFPELAALAQPLSGEYAGRRKILERVPFFTGYGVEIGLLIDIERRFGMDVIAQVDLDVRIHRNQSIDSLRKMSHRILSVLLMRAEEMGKLALLESLSSGIYSIHKHSQGYNLEREDVQGRERPPMVTVKDYQLKRDIREEDLMLIDEFSLDKPMTKISSLAKEELVNLHLKHRTRDDVLAEMVEMAVQAGFLNSKACVFKPLIDRETTFSTGLAGVAIPHTMSEEILEPVLVIGRSELGAVFGALDAKPVHLVFLMMTPLISAKDHLKYLASLAVLLKQDHFKDRLKKARTPREVLSLIKKVEAIEELNQQLIMTAAEET